MKRIVFAAIYFVLTTAALVLGSGAPGCFGR